MESKRLTKLGRFTKTHPIQKDNRHTSLNINLRLLLDIAIYGVCYFMGNNILKLETKTYELVKEQVPGMAQYLV